MLARYYREHFPAREIYKWLSQKSDVQSQSDNETRKETFRKRELVFTTENNKMPRATLGDGSYETFETQIASRLPTRIESVSINSVAYQDRSIHGPGFTRLEKDLGFDIDINDYDPVRTCCNEAKFCKKCWLPLIGCAVDILSQIMYRNFGFDRLTWVFSGRRGIHCWVLSTRARQMTFEQRFQLMKMLDSYFSIDDSSSFHYPVPSFVRQTLVRYLYQYLDQNDQLAENDDFLGYIGKKMFGLDTDYADRMCSTFQQFAKQQCIVQKKPIGKMFKLFFSKIFKSSKKQRALEYRLAAIVCRPRLDRSVTLQYGHPMKLPFCIHPKTDNICHAMSVDEAKIFFPSSQTSIKAADLLSDDNAETLAKFKHSVDTFRNLQTSEIKK